MRLQGRCPNCGGELVRRPVRPAEVLHRYGGDRACGQIAELSLDTRRGEQLHPVQPAIFGAVPAA